MYHLLIFDFSTMSYKSLKLFAFFWDTLYKLCVRPHLDYGDIIYHKYGPELNLDFTKKLEATQYSAALAVSGAWRETNKYKLYEELGWEVYITEGGTGG